MRAALPGIKIAQKPNDFGLVFDVMGTINHEENEDVPNVKTRILQYIGTTYPGSDAKAKRHIHVIKTMDGCIDTSHGSCNAFPNY